MNRYLGEKVAIVSDKPQTTRHRLVGILSRAPGQIVFLDTPGIHKPLHRLNQQMVRHALDALEEADIVCLIVDAAEPFGPGDSHLLEVVGRARGAKVAVFNKVDRVAKPTLLPKIEHYSGRGEFEEIVPISALTGENCAPLLEVLWARLPVGDPLYDPELLTVHPTRYLAAERIREKLLIATHAELPFTTAVVLDSYGEDDRGLVKIHASILVDRASQKRILVGHRGSMIKRIGTAARLDLERFLERRVFLDLRVRLAPRWRENKRLLAEMERELLSDLST